MNNLMGEQRAPPSETTKSPRWGRRILTGIIALAAMGGFCMIVMFSYDKGKEKGAGAGTPVIMAQQGPTKVKPMNPSGMPIRDQDKGVYDRLDPNSKKDKIENLLPAPELSMSKPAPMKLPKLSKKEVAMAKTGKPAAESNIVAPSPPPPPIIDAPTISAVTASAIKAASGMPKIEKKMAKPVKSAKKSVVPIKKMAVLKSGYRIQIASLKSEKAANVAWRKLQKNHPSLFGNLRPAIVRAVIAGKGTYYRLQAGSIKGQPAARALCSQAKKRKIGCLVVKPR